MNDSEYVEILAVALPAETGTVVKTHPPTSQTTRSA